MSGHRALWRHYFYYNIIFLLLLQSVQTNGENSAENDSKKSAGYYVVSAAGSIFSGRPFGVIVAIFNSLVSCSCEVTLSGPGFNTSIQMHLTPHEPISTYLFNVPELERGSYWLHVQSLRGLEFKNSTQLSWHNFKNFIKIQTPKTNYKPGELLQFRVFFHNETMNWVNPEPKALVWIEDAKGYRVKIYHSFAVTKGVFQSKLRLSRQPNLGRWRICAQNGVNVVEECAYIQVSQYELPAFEVYMQSPTEINITDNTLEVSVMASYAFDIPVEGMVILDIKTYTDVVAKHKPLRLQKKADLANGQVKINLDLMQFKERVPKNMPLNLRLAATVQEKSTETQEVAMGVVTLWGSNEIDFVEMTEAPVGRTWSKKKKPTRRPLKMTRNYISIDYGIPKQKTQMIEFKLDYRFKYAVCVIMFNGLILQGSVVYPDATNNYLIEVQFTMKMWPFVHIFLYGMEPNSKTLLLATQTITVIRWEHDHVEIDVPTQVSPGEEITLNIRAVPKSYVGLVAVDTRAFHFDDTINDFTDDYFDIIKFSLRACAPDLIQMKYLTAFKLGLVTLTNAPVVTDAAKKKGNKAAERTAGSEETLNPLDDQVSETVEPRTRNRKKIRNFDTNLSKMTGDVWIYDSIPELTFGWTNWTTTVPNEITNWRLSAFAVDPNVGLTLMESHYITIKSSKPLFMKLNVPPTIKMGEILVAVVSCFNHHDRNLNIALQVQQDISSFEILDKNRTDMHGLPPYELFVPRNGTNTTKLYLRALKPGVFKLQVTGQTTKLRDQVERSIRVQPKGPVMFDQAMIYHSIKDKNLNSDLQLDLLRSPSEEGVKCYFSSNMIAAQLKSLTPFNPMDGAEQVISKLISIYYLWDLTRDKIWAATSVKPDLEDQLNDGFQSLLRLRGRDGGITSFPQQKSSCSSTWLTAFALQAFILLQQSPVQFDDRLILQCEQFLLKRRKKNAKFLENCETPGRRKLNSLELSLEIFRVLQLSSRMLDLQESHLYINNKMANTKDYHIEAKRGFTIPEWIRPPENLTQNWMEYRRHLETSGRILLLQMQRKRDPQLELYNWLITQLYGVQHNRNCYECSVAEQAVYEFIRTMNTDTHSKLSISIEDNLPEPKTIEIHEMNQWQAQEIQLNTMNQTINFDVNGWGDLLIWCTYNYDPLKGAGKRSKLYALEAKPLEQKSSQNQFIFKFCVARNNLNRSLYVGTELSLDLPSGYVLSHESVRRLYITNKMVRIAGAANEDTKLRVQLMELEARKQVCLSVSARRVYKLEKLQAGMLSAYDTNSLHIPEVLDYKVT